MAPTSSMAATSETAASRMDHAIMAASFDRETDALRNIAAIYRAGGRNPSQFVPSYGIRS
jgi:hypothetical protein